MYRMFHSCCIPLKCFVPFEGVINYTFIIIWTEPHTETLSKYTRQRWKNQPSLGGDILMLCQSHLWYFPGARLPIDCMSNMNISNRSIKSHEQGGESKVFTRSDLYFYSEVVRSVNTAPMWWSSATPDKADGHSGEAARNNTAGQIGRNEVTMTPDMSVVYEITDTNTDTQRGM